MQSTFSYGGHRAAMFAALTGAASAQPLNQGPQSRRSTGKAGRSHRQSRQPPAKQAQPPQHSRRKKPPRLRSR